jgi:hypothetical protein
MEALFTGWDVQCAGLDAARKREANWNEVEQRWESAPRSPNNGDWGPIEEGSRWVDPDVKSFLVLYDMYRGVWPNLVWKIAVVDILVDVHSVIAGSLDRERSACRSLYPLTAFRLLTYLASYDTALSVLPMEATHLPVPIEELTHSSLPVSMLPAALSEALGISLADVMDRYFDRSEESVRVWRIEEALDSRREFEEGEEWLAQESCKMDAMLEWIHQGQDDASF